MEWLEIAVHTNGSGADSVSDTMMALGCEGTMIQDRADVPDPDKPNGIWELIDPNMINQMPEDVVVTGWFKKDKTLMDTLSALKAWLEEAKSLPLDMGSLEIVNKDVADSDWAEVWKQYYKPFHISSSLVIKPTWEGYTSDEGDKVIEMDPGMAFGTGTHESTAMCMTLLEDYLKPDMRVIDVGTGSGILAIGAALLGAKAVLAIDIDPAAVKVAKENIAHNRLEKTVTAIEGNLLDKVKTVCDLCVANIIADVICFLSEPLRAHIVNNGLFICSGIIKEREEDVTNALVKAGYSILEIRRKGEWVAMIARR
jgi:ribosomal protein L11 methyltransferase